uniref:Uncharacterized protein n=1 Tax=Vespula pensylvanica TaxID=30213 RepID=A0A834P939_VESPE|nr:hypothetical protein H0235_005222 [Vespula pensylvanica]
MARAIGKRAGWREKVCVVRRTNKPTNVYNVHERGANRMETHRRLPSSSRQRKSAKSVLTVARVPLQRSKTP